MSLPRPEDREHPINARLSLTRRYIKQWNDRPSLSRYMLWHRPAEVYATWEPTPETDEERAIEKESRSLMARIDAYASDLKLVGVCARLNFLKELPVVVVYDSSLGAPVEDAIAELKRVFSLPEAAFVKQRMQEWSSPHVGLAPRPSVAPSGC